MKRFMEKVDKTDDCWLWTASKYPTGYGQFSLNGKPHRAHRVAYELFVAPIPNGMYVLHQCDTPACVNPEHLFLGTQADNMRDMTEKARGSNPSIKLTVEAARSIKSLLEQGVPNTIIAGAHDVSQQTICDIKHGRSWVNA